MSKKKKIYQISEKKKNNNSFTLKGGYIKVKIDSINDHLQNVNRGAGVVQSHKLYNRKKNSRIDNDYDCSSLFLYASIFIQCDLHSYESEYTMLSFS